MRRSLAVSSVLLALLLGCGAAFGQGATLYVSRVLTVPPGSVTVGDVVRVVGPVPPESRELLLRTIVVAGDKVLYVPVSQYLSDLESAFGHTAIIVGSRTLVVPQGTSAQSESYLLERLADWLESQRLVGDDVTEITFTQGIARGSAPRDGTPIFRAQTSSRGITDVSFSLSDSAGDTVSGHASFASATGDPATAVHAGGTVQVVFRKGPITIQMPGRVLTAAGPGQSVTVSIPDSQKTFTGQVTDSMEVQVDLP